MFSLQVELSCANFIHGDLLVMLQREGRAHSEIGGCDRIARMPNVKTDLASFTPAFAPSRMIAFNERDYASSAFNAQIFTAATVDLSQVFGTEHGDYQGWSWQELIGAPAGSSDARLKRINLGMRDLVRCPDYYLGREQKLGWRFVCVDGRFFVTGGNHRTVIARYFLAINNLPPLIHGVTLKKVWRTGPQRGQ